MDMASNPPDMAALQRLVEELRAQVDAQASFMSFLSHDLRGSLNGMVLMIEVLKRELQDRPEFAETIDDLTLMRKSVLTSVTIMERYLQADRLRRRRIPCHPRPVRLGPLVRDVAGLYAEPARARGVEWAIEIPDDAAVSADVALLTTALQELLDNVAKHASSGPVRLVAGPSAEAGQPHWTLAIQDSGPGIDPGTLAKLIDPVKRAELNERGLGLVLAQLAIAQSGGRLEAQSKPGHGSEFRLVLPSSPALQAGASGV
jgi:signal transduction histidine kinase